MVDRSFDAGRARLSGPDMFRRFRVPDQGEPLAAAGLADSVDLVLVERAGQHRAFLVRQLAYHHLAQGTLAGQPYAVSF